MKKFRKKLKKRVKCLFKSCKKPKKGHKKLKKSTDKRARPIYGLAERIRGVLYLVIGLSVVYAAFIASMEGITGLTEVASALINSLPGRVILIVLGLSYVAYALWKIIMGSG